MVEDDRTDAFVIKQVLQVCGLANNVRLARDGQEALQYLQSLGGDEAAPKPALILLDLNVPKIPGIEILRHLRNGPWRSTPVVIVTSSISERDRTAAETLGAEAYFQKPNDLAAYMELSHVIKRILPD